MEENRFDTVIIGSGLGGLLCGYILSREGMKVCILEKENRPGGALQSFTRKGIHFNTGMHYTGAMGEGEVMNRYFRYFGLAGSIKLRQLNRDGFDIIGFDDGEYPLAQGFENFTERLLPYFPDKKNAIQRYVEKLKEIGRAFPLFNLEIPSGELKEHSFRSQSAFRFFDEIAATGRLLRFARNDKKGILAPLSSVLAGNNFLYAGDKTKTPLHIPALINHSFITSAWKIEGGSSRIVDSLIESIENFGGKIITGAEARRVHVTASGFSISCSNGAVFDGRQLIMGIHPAVALSLFDPSPFRKAYADRIRSLKNTTGVFSVYALLKKNAFPDLDHNYYYHASHDVWHHPGDQYWPAGYMLYTTRNGEKDTFAGSLVIMTSMDYNAVSAWAASITGKRDRHYYEFKEKMADQLLDLAEKRFPGIRSSISFMETSTPLTWRDYTGVPFGSMYGIQKDFNDPDGTMVLPGTKIPGLFFTGQNINLHGMTGVTTGAVMTCSEILGYDYLVKKIRNG